MYLSVGFICVTPDGVCGPVNCSPRDFDETLDEAIKEVHNQLYNYSADELSLHMNLEYQDQCCISFTPAQMKKMSDLGVAFTIDCWETE